MRGRSHCGRPIVIMFLFLPCDDHVKTIFSSPPPSRAWRYKYMCTRFRKVFSYPRTVHEYPYVFRYTLKIREIYIKLSTFLQNTRFIQASCKLGNPPTG